MEGIFALAVRPKTSRTCIDHPSDTLPLFFVGILERTEFSKYREQLKLFQHQVRYPCWHEATQMGGPIVAATAQQMLSTEPGRTRAGKKVSKLVKSMRVSLSWR